MSMTREEARIELQAMKNTFEEYEPGGSRCQMALKVALTALRPVSRERVEKVWRGCEKCNGAGEYSRYAENLTKILLAKYCPHCGEELYE